MSPKDADLTAKRMLAIIAGVGVGLELPETDLALKAVAGRKERPRLRRARTDDFKRKPGRGAGLPVPPYSFPRESQRPSKSLNVARGGHQKWQGVQIQLVLLKEHRGCTANEVMGFPSPSQVPPSEPAPRCGPPCRGFHVMYDGALPS
jgi:hypothetical protein